MDCAQMAKILEIINMCLGDSILNAVVPGYTFVYAVSFEDGGASQATS